VGDKTPFSLATQPCWRAFVIASLVSAFGFGMLFLAFIVAMDPYGIRVQKGDRAGPVMDLNQRFMYPRLVRTGTYDSAVFGTSTVRLLDPQKLNATLGGNFANLAMNAATPWEQLQLAELFVRHTPKISQIIWGIDPTWCDADADQPHKERTFRPFPRWLYDEKRNNDFKGHINFTTIEIAVRVLGYRLKRLKPRIRSDGYEVFTPPEETYDAPKARQHLWGASTPEQVSAYMNSLLLPYELTREDREALVFPALDWFANYLYRLPAHVKVSVIMPPVHISSHPQRGSREAAVEGECKARLNAIVTLRNEAIFLDFRVPSLITKDDKNYWDPLHYRLSVAQKLTEILLRIWDGSSDKTEFMKPFLKE
jgi:hypothetical protein